MRLLTVGGLRTAYRDVAEFVRDLRDYREAKRNRGDSRALRLRGRAVATAKLAPRDLVSFRRHLTLMRENPDTTRAVELIEGLGHALRRRYAIELPLPREIEQRSDGQVGVFWGPEGAGVTVLAGKSGLAGLLAGSAGKLLKGNDRELLDALRFQAAIQG